MYIGAVSRQVSACEEGEGREGEGEGEDKGEAGEGKVDVKRGRASR